MNLSLRNLVIGLAILASGCNGKTQTQSQPDPDTYDVTDYSTPKDDDTLLVSDRIGDKKTTFDPTVIDRRPLHGWLLNASDAVISLDIPLLLPDVHSSQLVLFTRTGKREPSGSG